MKPWLHLARISNLPTVWTNVTAAWLLAGGELADARLYWLILAGSLLYTGGMILNDAADVRFDREHRKERPIPSGQVSARAAWSVGMAMLVLGAGLSIGCGANALGTMTLVAAIMFYDLYHKPWAGSVIIMGSCRMLLYLMVGSVLLPSQQDSWAWWNDDKVLIYAAALGLYIIGLSQIARSDRWRGLAILIYLPLLTANCFKSVSRVPVPGLWDDFWSGMDLIVSAIFLLLLLRASHLRAVGKIGESVGLLLAGIVVVDALAISNVFPQLALAFVALAPLLRLWQRWVAAT